MPKTLFRIMVLFALILSAAARAADEKEIVDIGTVTGSTYSNQYFGLTVTIPDKWQVQDNESNKLLMSEGKKIISGDDSNLKAVMDASELNTLNLLSIFRYPMGAAVDFNPSFISVAEKVSQLPGIQAGSDYLFHAKKLLEMGQVKYVFPKEVYPEKLDDVGFDVLDAQTTIGSTTVKQRYYATIRKGYALCFIVSYTNDDQMKDTGAILKSVRFR